MKSNTASGIYTDYDGKYSYINGRRKPVGHYAAVLVNQNIELLVSAREYAEKLKEQLVFLSSADADKLDIDGMKEYSLRIIDALWNYEPFSLFDISAEKAKLEQLFSGEIMDCIAAFDTVRYLRTEEADEAISMMKANSMITKSYLFAFLKFAMPYMSREDFSKYLADAWIRCEAPNADPNFTANELVNLFRQSSPSDLMTADEYNAYLDLPDTLTVYRGISAHRGAQVKALSWTLDKDKAEWFAHRWGEDGTVYQAQIMKSDTFAFFLARGESEVIVNPKCLMDITVAEDMDNEIENDMKGFTL